MDVQNSLVIFSAVMSFAAALTSGSILLYLRTMGGRIAALETNQAMLLQQPQRCADKFVDAEQWLRSESYARHQLDKLIESHTRLETKVDMLAGREARHGS